MAALKSSTWTVITLALALVSCTERSPLVTEVTQPAFANESNKTPVIEVRDIDYVAGKGFAVDVAVDHGVVNRAIRDTRNRYVIELSLTYRNFQIMGDLPTVVLELGLARPIASSGGFDIFQMTVPWDGLHNGTPVTGELEIGYLAYLKLYRGRIVDLLGQSTGTRLVVIA